jgi:NTP pyrophosphatase (non-canonical NTP hydrolase)
MTTIYARALAHYGSRSQIDQTIEECAELIVALRHHMRGRAKEAQVIEELADVQIMLEQMRFLFGEADVDEVKREKLARLEKRMEGRPDAL